jgi:TPR repeat protein
MKPFPAIAVVILICVLMGCDPYGARTANVAADSAEVAISLRYDPQGTETDRTLAKQILRREAERGNSKAFLEIGRGHMGTGRSDSALYYFDRAIELGDTSAYAWAGMIYLRGLREEPPRLDRYVAVMSEAAEKGIVGARDALARFESNLNDAAENGNESAIQIRQDLVERGLIR